MSKKERDYIKQRIRNQMTLGQYNQPGKCSRCGATRTDVVELLEALDEAEAEIEQLQKE
ncbi:MAG: hypothetical protein ACE1Z4_07605 [Gammaproteobacteria bacterium]|jgi:hypothetical protein